MATAVNELVMKMGQWRIYDFVVVHDFVLP